MKCSDLMTTRDRMWDDIMNTFEVDDFVDLWGRPDPDILDVLLYVCIDSRCWTTVCAHAIGVY